MTDIFTIRSSMKRNMKPNVLQNITRRKKIRETCLLKYFERLQQCYTLVNIRMNLRIWRLYNIKKRILYVIRLLVIILYTLDCIRIICFLPVAYSRHTPSVVIFNCLIVGDNIITLYSLFDRAFQADMSINILKEFTELKSLEWDLKYCDKLYKRTLCKQYLTMIMFIIMSLITDVVCPVFVNRTNFLLKIYLYPLPMDSVEHIPLLVLRYCIHFVEIVPYYFYISASNVMNDLILKELRLTSSYLKWYKTKDDSDFKMGNIDIDNLCNHFQNVCNLLRLSNKITQMQSFFTILSGNICIFTLLYGWRNGLSHVLEYKYVVILSLGKVCHSTYIFLRGFQIYFMVSMTILLHLCLH